MSVFIERIKIKNLLSFDEEGIDFELKPLNVLIGANASGKSNFITSLRLISMMGSGFDRSINEEFGGIHELLWKGKSNKVPEFDVIYCLPNNLTACHSFNIKEDRFSQRIENERLLVVSGESAQNIRNPDNNWIFELNRLDDIVVLVEYPTESVILTLSRSKSNEEVPIIVDGKHKEIPRNIVYDRSRSFIENSFHPSVQRLRDDLYNVRYSSFYPVFGTIFLQIPNEAGIGQERLARDGSNLASYISSLEHQRIVSKSILPLVKEIYPNIESITTHTRGGRIHLLIHEVDLEEAVLQPRISDGLLRLVALLSILFQKNPPPILCLEEPENGFHPDVIRVLAKALKEASEHTQIIVTTHSPLLIGYLKPEDVVVCERSRNGGTTLTRQSSEKLKEWLEDYDMGDLWLKGEIGGTRY